MILRTFIMAAGLCGALVSTQFPTYSQQYLQRLGGAVHALDEVVADFDTSAAAQGMSRDQALAQMQGTAFVNARRVDMERTFERHARLKDDLALLEGHGPFMRAYLATHLTDREIARGTLAAFRPGLPLSLAGLLFAAFGFFVTFALLSTVTSVLRHKRRVEKQPA